MRACVCGFLHDMVRGSGNFFIAAAFELVEPVVARAAVMPLNVFAASQEIQFQIVSRKVETGWATETVCSRIVCSDGWEYEVQAVQDAKAQWSSLPLRVAFATVLPRGVVRGYSSGPKTGIRASCFIRLHSSP